MNIKYIYWINLALFLLGIGCTRKSGETSSVLIRMPSQNEISSQSWVSKRLLNFSKLNDPIPKLVLASDDIIDSIPQWGLAAPSNISEITCFAVFAGGPEQDLKKSNCYHSLSSSDETKHKQFFSYGIKKGLVGLGKSAEITVPSGVGRIFYLAGVKTADGLCGDFSEISGQDNESNFSVPILLGTETVDLEPGEKKLEISLKSSFVLDDQIAYCDDDLKEANPDSPPTTVTPPGGTTPPVTNAFAISVVQSQDLSASPVGSLYSLTVSITNTSQQPFESGITLPAPVTPFGFVSSGCGVILNVGESCVLTYTFSPLSVASYSDILPASVTYQGSTENFNVTLSGAGVLNSSLTVSELYTNFESWNEYVTSGSLYNSASACAGSETLFSSCVHAGERKKASLGSLYTTCSNLTASDSLGVFKWGCSINDLGHAEMRSESLMPGKGLRDLINFSNGNWNAIQLTVQLGGINIFQSVPSTAWWLNPTADLSLIGAGTALTSTSTIYYLNSNITRTSGWVVNGDQIGIVFNFGIKLTIASPTTLCAIDGESASPTLFGALCMGAQKFNWIEANIDMNGQSGNGIYVVDSKFNSIYLSKVSGQTGSHAGIKLYNSSCNKITDSEISNSQFGLVLTGATADNNLISRVGIDKTYTPGSIGSGIRLDTGADFNTFTGLKISRVYGTNGAIHLTDAASNRFFDFTISNSDKGIYIQQGNSNYFTGGTIAHISSALYGEGIYLSGGSTYNNYFSFLTIVGTRSNAIYAENSVDNTIFHQILAFNSDKGIQLQSTLDIFFSQIASINSITNPISFNTGTAPVVNGIVKFRKTGTSSTTVCDHNSGAVNCNNWGGTGVVATSTNPFVGLVNDSAQGGIGLTSISTSSVTNWFKFDNLFRFWGRAMTTTALIESLYSSSLGTESVQVFDLSLLVTDTDYLSRSGNGVALNGAMSGTCSSAVDASNAANVRASTGFNNPYLMNAKENMYATGSGDKDGLCETGESCIYAPNFGAYQGHGNLSGPCTFTDGNGVSGVGMFYYDVNGY